MSFGEGFNLNLYIINIMLNISNSVYYSSFANTYNVAKKKRLSKGIKHLKAILNFICLHKQESSFKKSYFNNIVRCYLKFKIIIK
jgi:hypothetical protein